MASGVVINVENVELCGKSDARSDAVATDAIKTLIKLTKDLEFIRLPSW